MDQIFLMQADMLANPIQGQSFKEMSVALMICEVDYSEDHCDNARLMEGKSPINMKGDITGLPQDCVGRVTKTVRWGQKEIRLMMSQERERPLFNRERKNITRQRH